jgi:2-haloacid dehalogenase
MTGKDLAVVFDLGGVLLDWNPRYLFHKLFADPGEMEWFLGNVCTLEWQHGHNLGEDVYSSCQRLAALYPDYQDMIFAWATRGEEMLAGPIDTNVSLLKSLKDMHIPCYALTNMEERAYFARRERFEFMKWFDGCVVSGCERVGKPDPRFFAILFERYGLVSKQCLFIDDRLRNVTAARALGMKGIQYLPSTDLRRELSNAGIKVSGPFPAPLRQS